MSRKGQHVVVELKTPAEIEAMRAAGRVVAQTLTAVHTHATVGTRLTELDEVARQVLRQAGAGADASRAAHAEHTVAITDEGPLILTAP
jgi:methionine aminopeptidase